MGKWVTKIYPRLQSGRIEYKSPMSRFSGLFTKPSFLYAIAIKFDPNNWHGYISYHLKLVTPCPLAPTKIHIHSGRRCSQKSLKREAITSYAAKITQIFFEKSIKTPDWGSPGTSRFGFCRSLWEDEWIAMSLVKKDMFPFQEPPYCGTKNIYSPLKTIYGNIRCFKNGSYLYFCIVDVTNSGDQFLKNKM